MLKRSLTEHTAGCFYGSRRIADILWGALREGPPEALCPHQRLLDQLHQELAVEVESRHPRLYRMTDLERLGKTLCPEDLFDSPVLPWLSGLFDRLMIRTGDYICYRDTAVQAYVRMAAEIDPALLVGWHLAEWIDKFTTPPEGEIRRVVEAQTRFFAPPATTAPPVAEGHVHLGGITSDGISLSALLLDLDIPPPYGQDLRQDTRIGDSLQRMRTLIQVLLHPSCADLSGPAPSSDQLQVLNERLTRALTSFPPPAFQALRDIAFLTPHTPSPHGSIAWCRAAFLDAKAANSPNHWLWLHLYLCLLYRQQGTPRRIRIAILCWYQMLNAVRHALVMDRQGLTRFARTYYGTPIQRNGPFAMADISHTLFANSADLAELKVSQWSLDPQNIGTFAEASARAAGLTPPTPPYIFGERAMPLDTAARNWIAALERWHFCCHFIRSLPPGGPRQPDIQTLWAEARTLRNLLTPTNDWVQPTFLGGPNHPGLTFQPANWLRGLDVAGDENDLWIEFFAPILRWLREAGQNQPDNTTPTPGFHLSIHAGEDYAHPASGMRHVDETVRFCGMRNGDRLGHALALGIPPLDWVERQGEMILPLDEHVDNLVWQWHHATALSPHLELAHRIIPILERRIRLFFPLTQWHLPPPFRGFSPPLEEAGPYPPALPHYSMETLVQAWFLRRNCYDLWDRHRNRGIPEDAEIHAAVPDRDILDGTTDAAYSAPRPGDAPLDPVQLYRNRHQWIRNPGPEILVKVRYREDQSPDRFQTSFNATHPSRNIRDGHPLIDEEGRAEMDFLHALQDHLLDTYDRQGLIIEANPTSNVYIARLESHQEHPIFRWNPPDETHLDPGQKFNRFGLRRGPVAVLVNTDDPGIMPTTLRTEYALLREAAVDLGHGRTVADKWLEKLRRFGLEQFKKNHRPIFTLNQENP